MKKWLLLFLSTLPGLAFAQDCTAKIMAAQKSSDSGNYRLALAQLTAAVTTCGESRRPEIEKKILDIYDKIELLRDSAIVAQKRANKEAENALAARREADFLLNRTKDALEEIQILKESCDSLYENLLKANEDRVLRMLAEVVRNQNAGEFDDAVEILNTAKILGALQDLVDQAEQNLSHAMLEAARDDLKNQKYRPAITTIKIAEDLNILPEEVAATKQELRVYLFEHIQLDLLNSDYDSASEKIQALRVLQVPVDTIEGLWLESAFCYIEIGHPEKARAALDSVAQIRPDNQLKTALQELHGKTPEQQSKLLRQILRQYNPVQAERISNRYFPKEAVRIPGGSIIWKTDSNDEASGSCVIPVQPFLLNTKEVTFLEYDLFCAATNRSKPSDGGWGRGQRPVINVDWFDAVAYCNWRSLQEGYQEVYSIDMDAAIKVHCNWSVKGYRLPMEAEWAFAAGNGEKQTKYAWGNDEPTAALGGNVTDVSAQAKFPDWKIFPGYSDGFAYTAPTGSFAPNDYGLYDMSGNVWEWCWDEYVDNYCRAGQKRAALKGADSSGNRVLRGGSWGSYPHDCQVNTRYYNHPAVRNFSTGFRLAMNEN